MPDQPDSKMVDSKDEGRAKTLIYHKLREFLAVYPSVLAVILK